MNREKTVDVCVATFRRPAPLASLLESLASQNLPEIRMRVLVVDNDPGESARAVVQSFAARVPFAVLYFVEPTAGISYTRNRALDQARAEYLAFVDDDETVDGDWLRRLAEALEKNDADAVFGRVQVILPEGAPDWAKRFYLFHPPPVPAGKIVTHGPSNNTLVRASALGTPPLRFSPAFALTGGSDTEFFFQLHLAGKKLITSEEGLVYDHWPMSRLTVGWICRRRYRVGQCYARVFVARYSKPAKIKWMIKTLCQIALGAALVPLIFVFYHRGFVELLTRLSHVGGKISGLFGSRFYYQEYSLSRSGPVSPRDQSNRQEG